jgi:hypothetical protein
MELVIVSELKVDLRLAGRTTPESDKEAREYEGESVSVLKLDVLFPPCNRLGSGLSSTEYIDRSSPFQLSPHSWLLLATYTHNVKPFPPNPSIANIFASMAAI